MKAFELLNRRILFSAFLIAFLIVSVVPLLISGYHSLRRTEDELKSSLNENNYLVTRYISNELEELQVEKWISTLNALSSSLSMNKKLGLEQTHFLINSYFSQIRELAVLSTRTHPRSEIKHYINQRFMDEFKAQNPDSLCRLFSFHTETVTRDNAADIGKPIFLSGDHDIFLPIEIAPKNQSSFSVSLRGVFQLVPAFGFIDSDMSTAQRQVYILDGEGRILFQNQHGQFKTGTRLPYLIDFSSSKKSFVFQTLSFHYSGRKYLGYVFPSPRTGWLVVVAYLHDKAYALVSQMRQRILFYIGIALILSVVMSFGFAWFHSSVIVHAKEVLQRYAEKLEQSNAELEAFAYSVTHELSAPLRHIMSYSDILEMRLSSKLDPKSLHQLQNISSASKDLHELIYNILLFSRVGYADLHKTWIDLKQTVRTIRAKLETETSLRKISWKTGRCSPIWGDPIMIQQVLFNLISNAVKFTRTRKKAVIQIGTTLKPEEVIVSIRDNGIGFDMKDKNKLFGMFQRLHNKEEFEGTGVGLAHVRRIIAKHGGRTWAESETGKGAVFYFSLPKEAGPIRFGGNSSGK
jgi:signal transduction histidine kinase